MLFERSTAYLISLIIYCGSDTKCTPPADIDLLKHFDEYANPSKVVLSLASSHLNQGYCIIVWKQYWYLLDASKKSRNRADDEVLWWKICRVSMERPIQKMSTKIVSMLSSIHVGDLVGTGKVDFATKQSIVKPDAIVDYNENMEGVDLLSHVIVPCSTQQKHS